MSDELVHAFCQSCGGALVAAKDPRFGHVTVERCRPCQKGALEMGYRKGQMDAVERFVSGR